MVEIYNANHLFTVAKEQIEEEVRNKAIEKFNLCFNREAYAASLQGEFNVAISKERFPTKYMKEILTMLEEKGFEVAYRAILCDYIISWRESDEEE